MWTGLLPTIKTRFFHPIKTKRKQKRFVLNRWGNNEFCLSRPFVRLFLSPSNFLLFFSIFVIFRDLIVFT